MTKDKQVSVILAKVFNCGASQCMSIYTEKDTLTPEQALIDLRTLMFKVVGKDIEAHPLQTLSKQDFGLYPEDIYKNQAKAEIRQSIEEMFK